MTQQSKTAGPFSSTHLDEVVPAVHVSDVDGCAL